MPTDRCKNGCLRKYHYSKIRNPGDCVARTGVRDIGFKPESLPYDPGGITCMYFCFTLQNSWQGNLLQNGPLLSLRALPGVLGNRGKGSRGANAKLSGKQGNKAIIREQGR